MSFFFLYGETRVSYADKANTVRATVDGEDKLILRNTLFEKDAASVLRRHGVRPAGEALWFRGEKAKGRFTLDVYSLFDYERAWSDWLNIDLPELTKVGWHVVLPQAAHPIELTDSTAWYADLAPESENEWFDLELGVDVAGERLSLLPLLHKLISAPGLLKGQEETVIIQTDAGRIELPFDRVRRIAGLVRDLTDPESAKEVRLSRIQAAQLNDFLDKDVGRWALPEQVKSFRDRLKGFSGIADVTPPEQFRGELRPYQRAGLSWLTFLRDLDLGEILADDMGLGKTVQLIAFLLRNPAERGTAPHLIVSPKSLTPNWQAELERFAPSLQVFVHAGQDRDRALAPIKSADVVLTTYPLLLRDAEAFASTSFDIVAFDEAQFMKNPTTATYRAAVGLQAKTKLVVTGTPVENNLDELWAHVNLVLPGFLGSRKHFRDCFRNPIEKEGSTARKRELSLRLRPFVLRRRKDEVLSELPPVTNAVQHIELEGAQRDLYETIRLLMDKKVREALRTKGAARSRIEFLDALLKLRQVCCDPLLVKAPEAKKVKTSAKRAYLLELLDSLVAEERQVIIFSQFTSMLSLIESDLRERKLPYSLLTGETDDRTRPVDDFQNGRTRTLLMSLKAGGVGLNLTATDTVILYNPWWNPAAEDQAIGRAHRIGQNKPVFVYRLVVKGSIEEKILALQDKKRDLVDGLLGEEDSHLVELNEALLEDLFQPL